jgi:hypothetical protein
MMEICDLIMRKSGCGRSNFLSSILIFVISLSSSFARETQSLEKDSAYFYDRYGSQKQSRTVKGHLFVTPFNPPMVRVGRPYLVRSYGKGKLSVEVVFEDSSSKATWVSLRLPRAWTDDQLKAALESYGSGWHKVRTSSLNQVMMSSAGLENTWISEEGIVCYYVASVNQVMFYSPEVQDLIFETIVQSEVAAAQVPAF